MRKTNRNTLNALPSVFILPEILMCSSSSARKTESAFGIDCDYLAAGSNVCSVFIHFFHGQVGFIVSKVNSQIVAATLLSAAPRSQASVSTEATVRRGRRHFKKMQHYNQYKDSKNIAWLYPTAPILIGTCVKKQHNMPQSCFSATRRPARSNKKPLRTCRKGFSLYNFRS